jgi:hypothetical protein
MAPCPPEARWPEYILSALSTEPWFQDGFLDAHGDFDLGELAEQVPLGCDPLGALKRLEFIGPGFFSVQVWRPDEPSPVDWGSFSIDKCGDWRFRSLDGRIVAGPGFAGGGSGEWDPSLVGESVGE